MDISNKSLAFILIATMVVSIAGLFFSMNKIDEMSITGYAAQNASGTATLTIGSTARLIFQDAAIAWGAGSVNTTGGNLWCNLTTENSNDDATYCLDFDEQTDGLTLRNDGNTVFTSVKLNSSHTSDTLLAGDDPLVLIRATEESNACLGDLNWSTMTEITSVFTVAIGSAPQLCEAPGFNFTEADDDIYLDINVSIPYNAPAGAKTLTLRAQGTY
ncbi:hypothetical protein JXC34_03915 [Candidatus Woesearchaeota archaeon]|nr:hypothetical protein [Candidatus Woesearchaeota archaeon]